MTNKIRLQGLLAEAIEQMDKCHSTGLSLPMIREWRRLADEVRRYISLVSDDEVAPTAPAPGLARDLSLVRRQLRDVVHALVAYHCLDHETDAANMIRELADDLGVG